MTEQRFLGLICQVCLRVFARVSEYLRILLHLSIYRPCLLCTVPTDETVARVLSTDKGDTGEDCVFHVNAQAVRFYEWNNHSPCILDVL